MTTTIGSGPSVSTTRSAISTTDLSTQEVDVTINDQVDDSVLIIRNYQSKSECPLPNKHGEQAGVCLFDKKDFNMAHMYVDFGLPVYRYERRSGETKTTIKCGQRKLLLGMVHFLTTYAFTKYNILYIGAAPGINVTYLTTLFPKHKFRLYDPSPFDTRLETIPSVKIVKALFTDEDAKKFIGKDVALVSDIRNIGYDVTGSFEENERMVMDDLTMQANWVRTIRPSVSMLKVRLPYINEGQNDVPVKYFDGGFFIQQWTGPSSSETRLIVTDVDSEKEYSSVAYQDQLFTHNTLTRPGYHDHTDMTQRVPWVDYCYDCTSEMLIWANYLTKNMITPLPRRIAKLMNMATDFIGHADNCATPSPCCKSDGVEP